MESTTLELYEKAMSTKRVPLSIMDTLLLWTNPALLFGLSIWYLYEKGAKLLFPTYFGIGMYFVPLFIWLAMAWAVRSNIRDCKFTFLVSKIPIHAKEEVIIRCKERLKWNLLDKSRQYYRFSDRTTLMRWSNYITIVWNEEGYFVNSLDSNFKTVILFGNPWKRVEDVVLNLDSIESEMARKRG